MDIFPKKQPGIELFGPPSHDVTGRTSVRRNKGIDIEEFITCLEQGDRMGLELAKENAKKKGFSNKQIVEVMKEAKMRIGR